MGLLFGKKKDGSASSAPIHKSQHNTSAPRVNTSGPSVNAGGSTSPKSNNSSGGGNNNNGGGSFSLNMSNAGIDPPPDLSSSKAMDIKYDHGGGGGGLSKSGSLNKKGGIDNSGGLSPKGNFGSKPMGGGITISGSAGVGGHVGGGMGGSNQMQGSGQFSPIDRVVNIYGISMCLFNITRTVVGVQEWNDPLFLQLIETALVELDKELRVLRNPQELRDWVHPLHYRKTGAVIGAGRRITIAHSNLVEWTEKLKKNSGNDFGPSEQRLFRESLKEVVSTYVQLCVMVEMVVPADFNGEINELARTMRDLVDTASGKLNYVFDDVARICTTCSIRLSRLGLWKGLQVVNIGWVRQVNDTCFTVSKATKVLYVIGQKLYENMSDRAAYDNLTTLTRGIVVQIKKLQELVQVEPPNHSNMVITFTNEVIYEHLVAYDAAIKEVSSSLSNYIRNNTDEKDMTVNSITKIISQLEIVKNSVRNPDIQSLIAAVASISDSLEKFCASVYHVLHLLGDQNEVIKEQVMETMQQALHGCVQLQLVVVTKGLSHNVVNPENTMLISVRFLLLSVSIIVDAIDFMKQGMLVLEESDNEDVPLGPDEIHEAIVYILHYGRPLYRGDDVQFGQDTEEPSDLPQFGSYDVDVPITLPITNFTIKGPKYSHTVYDSDDGSPRNTTGKSNTPINLSGILPAGTPAPAPVTKSLIDMSPIEFKNYCDANGRPNPDSFTETNLPPNFEKPPPKAIYKEGSSREEYKAYMVAKYEYETWENKLVLFKIKLKKKLEEIK